MSGADQMNTFEKTIFPVDFFSKKSNKTTSLINNNDQKNELSGRHVWYNFEFNEPLFVCELIINVSGYNNYNDFEIELMLDNNTVYRSKTRSVDGVVSISVNRIVSFFRFRPESKIFESQFIQRVSAYGYTPLEFRSLEKEISNIILMQNDIQSKKSAIEQIEQISKSTMSEAQAKIKELNDEISNLEKNVGQSSAKLEGLNSEISHASSRRVEIISIISELQSKKENLNNNKIEIEKNINELIYKKTKLIDDIRLFPSEISGLVEEGNRAINLYKWIIFVSMAIVVAIVTHLIFGAWKFTSNEQMPPKDVFSTLLSRTPLVVIYFIVFKIFAFIIGRMAEEIVKISNQRINVTAISVIAKDVSTSSSANTDLTSDERYEKETFLKMELLREHMKHYVSENYRYKQGDLGEKLRSIFSSKKSSDEEK